MKIVLEESKGKKKSQDWFRREFLTALKEVSKSVMRPKKGDIVYFEYDGQNGRQDRYPLVYVVGVREDTFFGANLHLVKPEKRLIIVDKLLNNSISLPRNTLFTYSSELIVSEMYSVPKEEWSSAASLPLEKFYRPKKNAN
jgi:hypothetical protein